MRFSVSAREMLGVVDERAPEDPVRAPEAYREVALRYEAMYDFNARWIRRLFWCFRGAIVCLVLEVALWIAVIEGAAR